MPIKVTEKQIQWSETDAVVHVVVPLKGVKSAKADIYSTDVYIKVNFPPFLFEADLFAAIDDSASSATIGKGTVEFKLVKREQVTWGRLSITGENANLQERRLEGQERSFKAQADAVDKKKEEHRLMQKAAVQKQIDQDRAETQKLTDLKDLEKSKANADIEIVAQQETATAKASAKAKGKKPASSAVVGPPVRASGEIKVSFTKRHFATAARESHAAEEEEWLSKQMAARKAVNEAKEKAKEGGVEADPLWYKDKGNEFYKAGNFQSAINAYTAGVALDNKMAGLFSNRAACHLAQNDFYAAGNDCSQAISLLTPPVEANRRSRLLAYSRRAAALAAVSDYESAVNDMREANRLDPDNESLKADLATLMAKMNRAGGAQDPALAAAESDGGDPGEGDNDID